MVESEITVELEITIESETTIEPEVTIEPEMVESEVTIEPEMVESEVAIEPQKTTLNWSELTQNCQWRWKLHLGKKLGRRLEVKWFGPRKNEQKILEEEIVVFELS